MESVTARALAKGEEVETRVFNVRMLEVEEVAATVRTDLTSAEVVPMATLSVRVVRRIRVPVSVQPPAELASDQERIPDPSVCRNPFAVCVEGQVYAWVLKVVAPVTARVEEPVIGPEVLREPETKSEEPMVEEAWEKNPDWRVASPPIVAVEVAENLPEIARSPE